MDTVKQINLVMDSISKSKNGLLEYLTGVLTIFIGILTVYIAYQQYRINRQHVLVETYERKLEIFRTIQSFLNEILRDGKTEYKKVGEFYTSTSHAIFFFDNEILNKIEEIYKNSIKLVELMEKLYPTMGQKDLLIGEERNKVSSENKKYLLWLTNQISETRILFARKMAIK